MYKKFTLFSLLVCLGMFPVSDVSSWLEIKPGYFLFSSSPMDDVYHDGFQIQGSASIPCCEHIDFYASIGYRTAGGRALTTCEKTKVAVVPVDIGLKALFNMYEPLCCFFSIGPRFFHIHQNNTSPYVNQILTANGIGLFVNTGFEVAVKEHILLGVFGEYSYEKKTICSTMQNVFSNGDIQLGGFAFGVSLGYVL